MPNQKSIEIPDNVESIGAYAFYQCPNIESVSFGNGLKAIEGYAFYGPSSRKLNTLVFPEGIISIGSNAFDGWAYVESIDFGKNIESIGNEAFKGCTRVASMICLAEITPEVGYNGLSSISSQAELYVLKGSLQRYQLDDNWNRFLIREYEESHESIENVEPEDNTLGTDKIFRDGQIFILRGDHTYTLTGQGVK